MKKILVVDDSAVNIISIRSMLQLHGIKVIEASNGKEALDKLDSHDCDLLLLDIQMPVLDGLETTKRIRSGKSDYKNIPIIGLSGDSSNETLANALHYGMNDYLVKPVDRIILIQKVSSLI